MIVLVWADWAERPVRHALARTRIDLGQRVPMESYLEGSAAVWCRMPEPGDSDRAIDWCIGKLGIYPRSAVLDVPDDVTLAQLREWVVSEWPDGSLPCAPVPAFWTVIHVVGT